jgi:hypothetical protein
MNDRTERRAEKHCHDRLNPSRQSPVVAVRERRVRADARDRQCQDGRRQIWDCELADSGIPCAHGQRRQGNQSKG